MQFYKHYCFDLWHTLIRPCPAFKEERNRYFYHHFNFGGKPLEEVAMIFRQVDLMCNSITEITGKNMDARQMYLMVIDLLNNQLYPLSRVDLDSLIDEIDSMLLSHVPLLSSPQIPELLSQLKEPGHISMSIVSNTGFIRGKTLKSVLKRLDIDGFFDFQLYSDETGASASHPRLCELIQEHISQFTKARPIDSVQIIHISDNPAAHSNSYPSIRIGSLQKMINYSLAS